MRSDKPDNAGSEPPSFGAAADFQAWSRRLWRYSSRGIPRTEFLRRVTRLLVDLSRSDVVELCLKEGDMFSCCRGWVGPEKSFHFETVRCEDIGWGGEGRDSGAASACDRLRSEILHGKLELSSSLFTKEGVFWSRRAAKPFPLDGRDGHESPFEMPANREEYKSIALIPLGVGDESVGLLTLKSNELDQFSESDLVLYEDMAKTLSAALVNQRVQAALRERVKELACLYHIARLAGKPETPIEEILQGIAELLPPAWQYPEVASGRIVFDGRSYTTPGFQETGQRQRADIVVDGRLRGAVEVTYSQQRPELDEGPFLKEERSLIDTIATQVALMIEQRQAEEDKLRLQEQLMHADRLATIGQLAAGVAHELNEPLGSILGFAQLTRKHAALPTQAGEDIDKIVEASLHAREVIRKLLLFSRQKLPSKSKVSLNRIIEEGLYFLKSRCGKAGVELVRDLSDSVPEITADPVQLHQALVNLVVNALQAMPKGGRLTIRTDCTDDHVLLIVEDTGSGMSDEVMRKIFIPFFTTKDVREGTGLGLALVHGIVTSHAGSIEVESKIGRGSRFTVKLPVAGAPDLEGGSEDAISE